MAKTIDQGIEEFVRQMTPSDTERDAATKHRWSIQNRLDDRLGIREMFETGSLRHGTAVRGHCDADYFISLKGNRPADPRSSLTRVRDCLDNRFSYTKVGVRHPAVVCEFGGGDEVIEVVPAYPDSEDSYWIPDPAGGWMRSAPKKHLNYVTQANNKHSGQIKHLARLLKAWKYRQNVPISSFYLEMRSAKRGFDESAIFLLWDMCLILEALDDNDLPAMNDPQHVNGRINPCSGTSKRQEASSAVRTAARHARAARDAQDDRRNHDGFNALKRLFGRFPDR